MQKLVRETGVTILVVTHDLGLAWNIADRIAVMYLGRIVEQGTTEELLVDPRHPTRGRCSPSCPSRAHMAPQILTGEAPDPTRIPAGCRFHPRCPLVASGEADAAGHRGALPRRGPRASSRGRRRAGLAHRAACHAVPTAARRAGRARGGRSVRVTTRLTYTSGASTPEADARVRGRARRRCATGRPSRSPTSSAASAPSTGPAFERRDPSDTGRVASRAHEAPDGARRGGGRARAGRAARVAAHPSWPSAAPRCAGPARRSPSATWSSRRR